MRASDPFGDLERWTARLARSHDEPDAKQLAALRVLVADVRLAALADTARRNAGAGALLDLSFASPAGAPKHSLDSGSSLAEAQGLGRDGLRSLLRGESGDSTASWLAAVVLARADSQAVERRAAAARCLEGMHLPPTRLALFGCAVDADAGLRRAAQEALAGWEDDGVHHFLLAQLESGRGKPSWISPRLVREHFSRVQLALSSPVTKEVAQLALKDLRGKDWRAAYRSLQLAAGLPDEIIVPVLIEALRDWQGRRALGKGRLRLEGDIAADLRRRTGCPIGPYPERWAAWWRAHQGREPGDGAPVPADSPTTATGFFGLRPLTDRVIFVLDRSGSMQADFGEVGHSRYQEAIRQLGELMTVLGPEARFRVIQFSSDLRVWSAELQPATKSNLSSVEAWMRYLGPDGATNLQPAVASAMELDALGRIDLARLEADTVIVLCDGETAEGPGWVRPLLEGANEEAALVFHCVQIGTGGDGTLERLAEGTGGEFVRVED
jgi:hypothetical protein